MSVLEVKDVSIRYLTGDFKDIGLKEYVVRKLTGNYHVTEFWADRHISFTLEKGEMLGSPLRPVRMERRADSARSPAERQRAARDGDPGEGRAPSSRAPAGSPNSGGSIGAGLTSAPTNDHSASCPPAPPRRRGESAWGGGGGTD